jgi:hypothetical protein
MTAIRRWKLAIGEFLADPGFHVRAALMLPEQLAYAWRARKALGRYLVLDEAGLRATRRSDAIFIFGSGYSINDLTPADVAHFEQHETLGFNWFVHQNVVRMDYHLVREISHADRDPAVWRPQVREYFELARTNPRYRDTIFLLQSGVRALSANRALALGLVPETNRIFLWRSRRGRRTLGRTFSEGLSHPDATIEDCVNFAYLGGWRRIVLVGVDLYDRRYFWLAPNETRSTDRARGAASDQPHQSAGGALIRTLGEWARVLDAEGVTLSVHNPRSLLSEVLPVYGRPAAR